jgi:nicotinamidase-related amidase
MIPRHPNTLDPARTALVIVDLQEAFRPVIHRFDRILAHTAAVARAMSLLQIPLIVTEQVPQKLGRTVSEILDALPPQTTPMDKSAFSCCGCTGFADHLKSTSRTQILVAGIEAHVCVNQTAHDLLAADYQVHLLTDCISSRRAEDRETALAKMQRSGCLPTNTEMALFELMRDAKHEHFRAISKLVKSLPL